MLAFGQRPPKLHSVVEFLRATHPGAPRFAPGETPCPPSPFAGGDDRARGIGAEPACRGRDHCGDAAVPARVKQREEVAPTNDASRFRDDSVSRSDSTIAAGTSPDAGSIRGVTREVTHAAVTAAAYRARGPTRPRFVAVSGIRRLGHRFRDVTGLRRRATPALLGGVSRPGGPRGVSTGAGGSVSDR